MAAAEEAGEEVAEEVAEEAGEEAAEEAADVIVGDEILFQDYIDEILAFLTDETVTAREKAVYRNDVVRLQRGHFLRSRTGNTVRYVRHADGTPATTDHLKNEIIGKGMHRKQSPIMKQRGERIRKLMRATGMTLPQASHWLKKNGY